jgi:hypothetical protein
MKGCFEPGSCNQGRRYRRIDLSANEVTYEVRAEASVRGTLTDIEVERRGGEQARQVEREA